MHEEPQVPNYRTGRRGRKLEPGLCLAIEPMFTLGDYRAHVLADDWTVATVDGSLAAHFENIRSPITGGDGAVRSLDRPRLSRRRPTGRLPGSASFDTLRVRVSARPGRHCA